MSKPAGLAESRIGLTAVVAIATNGVIGRDGNMPWRLSSDLRRFKKLTMGGVLIMGRKTYDSIGRPLPGRHTIVITRNPDWTAAGVTRVGSPQEAIAELGDREGFVVGGAEIYRVLLPECQRLMLTRVLAEIEGDTMLQIDLSGFEIVARIDVPLSDRDEYSTEFLELARVAAADSAGGPTKN